MTKVLHFSPESESIFYISNEADSRGRFIYKLNLGTKIKTCLTCGSGTYFKNVRSDDGLNNITSSECLYYDAVMGSENWMLMHCLGRICFSFFSTIQTKERK